MTPTIRSGDISAAFTKVYDENVWQREGTSGPGSSVEHTKLYRKYLQDVIRNHNVRRVLDVGCGIWEYMHKVDLTNVEYLGIDPVPFVIAKNLSMQPPPNVKFQCAVLSGVKNLPSYDLAIVKDVMQHLPTQLVLEMLEQLKCVRLLLLTNDLLTGPNVDCALGGFRQIDLQASPFNLHPIDHLDFQSIPFVKRTLLVRNDVGASLRAWNT